MARVSGRVIFDVDRTGTITPGDTGIPNVPVVLQNLSTNERLTILTDSNGDYLFLNVPNGNYIIVESYGTTGGIPTPGNYPASSVGPQPTGGDPPISFVTGAPAGSTDLDSLNPNTQFITVNNSDVTNINFFDGPIINTPIDTLLDSCLSITGSNIITEAANGTFGTFTAGTPVETGPGLNPYPAVSPGFVYTIPNPPATRPFDGSFTIQNIMTNMTINNANVWWRLADHTIGDETGRFQAIGGSNPGATFFEDTVNVTPNTNYLFSAWITNLIRQNGFAPPLLGIEILDEFNNVIYLQSLGNSIPASLLAPEWKELGSVINSGANNQLTVRFRSEGPAATGNDFAIDDIQLREVSLPDFELIKESSNCLVTQGSTITYTTTLTNPCDNPFTNLIFQDILPANINFIPDTVEINGVQQLGLDPEVGFPLPDLAAGATVTISFQVTVDAPPDPNPIQNTSNVTFQYNPVDGGIPIDYDLTSTIAEVKVVDPQPDEISIQAIVEAESGILDCMADFFCSPGGAVDMIRSFGTLDEKIYWFGSILDSYSAKENSIAQVLEGAAKKLAADKEIFSCNIFDCCCKDPRTDIYDPCNYDKEFADCQKANAHPIESVW